MVELPEKYEHYDAEDILDYFEEKYGVNLYDVEPHDFFSDEANKSIMDEIRKYKRASFVDFLERINKIYCYDLEDGYTGWEREVAIQLMEDLSEYSILVRTYD